MSEPCDGCAADATHYLCDLCASEDIEKVTKERDEAQKALADLQGDDDAWRRTYERTHADLLAAEADAARLREVEALTGPLTKEVWERLSRVQAYVRCGEALPALAGEEVK